MASRHGSKPHGLAGVVQDQASVLTWTRLVGAVLGRAEHVAGGHAAGLRGHLDDGGLEIRSRAEGPGLPRSRGRGGRPGAPFGLAAQGSAQSDPSRADRRRPNEPSSRNLRTQNPFPPALARAPCCLRRAVARHTAGPVFGWPATRYTMFGPSCSSVATSIPTRPLEYLLKTKFADPGGAPARWTRQAKRRNLPGGIIRW
jgi:hypothetical protein